MSELERQLTEHEKHLEEIEASVEKAIARFDASAKAEQAEDQARSDEKERLSQRVSLAAIALTMLMSFLTFARAERDDAGKALRLEANVAEREADANWSLYHSRATDRASFERADDQLTRDVATMRDEDPRLRLAQLNHVEYASRITALDNQCRRVFYVVQDLEQAKIKKLREVARIEEKVRRYDMGARVLTLALVILSITLLANQRQLLYAAIFLAMIGAAIAVSGYFMR